MDTLDKDELRKSLLEFFTPEEAEAMIVKAEKDGKFGKESDDDDADDNKTIDQEASENAKEDDGDEVKKAYDKIMSMKADLDKSMCDFLDKFGSMPGVKTPDSDFTKKAVDNDIEKAFGNEITKSFDAIQKGFDAQNKANEEFRKSLMEVSQTVNQIAQAPNPLKGLYGKYQFLEKSEKTNDDGKKVINVRNKEAVQHEIMKAMDTVSNEQDKQTLGNMLSDFTISNRLNPEGLDIVKKALDVDFEK